MTTVSEDSAVRTEAFFDYMQSLILDKACYENTCKSLDDAIKYKGITKCEFQSILNNHQLSNNNRQQKVLAYFEKIYHNVLDKIKANRAYARFRKIENRIILEQHIKQILEFINKNDAVLEDSESEVVKLLLKSIVFDNCFDNFDKECLIIIALVELEENVA
ncbi:MAG: hypothetical protein K2J89_00630 [Clostridia bacterium]|nr:hypothetical protein [Clostridia bacterium]